MSGGKTKSRSSSTTSTTQSLNPWSQNQWQSQFNNVRGLLDSNPVGQSYGGDLVAGLSGREQQARGLFEQNMGSFNPQFDQSADMIRGAGTYADFGGVADQYMNPYQQNVVDVAIGDINRNRDDMNASSRDAALQNRAYGGSRQAVAEGINNEAALREVARTSANLNYQGYNDARNYYGMDQQDQISRAGMLADLASGRHNMATQDIMGLNGLGEVDRGIEQDRMGANYNEWLRQQDDVYRRSAVEQGLLGQVPMLINSNGTQNSSSTQSSNPGLMGALGTAASIGAMFVPGGQIAGLGGLFSSAMKKAPTSPSSLHYGGQ